MTLVGKEKKSYFRSEEFVITEFKKVYDRLGVHIVERGESFYQEMMKEVVQELDDKGEFNPSCTNGFFHLVCYNKHGMVHYADKGVQVGISIFRSYNV